MSERLDGLYPTTKPPKSGSRRLVWIDLKGLHVNDRSFWRFGCWDGKFWRDGHGGRKLDPQPTHWMHAPRPPEALQ